MCVYIMVSMPTMHCGLYYKSFTITTYNHNDSGLHYITTLLAKAKLILTNLALAKDVIYDHNVHCKLKHTLQS
jgi:hypothetical protein